MFSREFCKILKNTCFAEHHQTTASDYSSINSISIIPAGKYQSPGRPEDVPLQRPQDVPLQRPQDVP